MIGILEDNEKSILKDEGSFPQLMPCFFSFDLAFRSSHSIFKVSHGLFRFVQLALPVVLSFFLVGNSQGLWRARLAEGIFAIDNPSWDDAWRIAIGFHRDLMSPVPQPSHLFHLAAARLANGSHFLSLHAPSRQLARQLGFELLPEAT